MLHAGLARTDITVFEPGMAMMGWGLPEHQAHRVGAPLHARALVVREGEGGARWAMVVVDLLIVTRGLWLEVLHVLRTEHPQLGLDAHNTTLAATHTHSGPSGFAHSLWLTLNAPGFAPRVHDGLVDGIVQALVEATAQLGPAKLVLARGEVEPGVAFNRSWFAYSRNVDTEAVPRERRGEAVDTVHTLLRVERPNGRVVGLLDWFGLHNTCLHANHDALHPDHKGLAAAALEERFEEDGLVAIFAQECCGDVSPNFRDAPERGHTVGPHDDDHESAQAVADAQVRAVTALLDAPGVELTGPVQSIVEMVDLSSAEADARFTVDGRAHRTTSGTIGISMALGTAEGRGPLWPARRLLRVAYRARVAWDQVRGRFGSRRHDPKLPLVDVGRGAKSRVLGLWPMWHLPPLDPPLRWIRRQVREGHTGDRPWIPHVLPIQVLRVGSLVLTTMPCEPTTVSGRRLRAVMLAAAPEGVTHAVVAPYANGYAGYLTTAEEYQVQHYEAGYTLHGPHSLAALQTVVERLTRALGSTDVVGTLPERLSREELMRIPYVGPWEGTW